MRGKQDKPTEFGAELRVSLTGDGVASVDHLRWDAFHEGHDLKAQVEGCRERFGSYPEVVLGDTIYGSRDKRRYLKERGIRFEGKPLGRPRQVTNKNLEELKRLAAQRRKEHFHRIPFESRLVRVKMATGSITLGRSDQTRPRRGLTASSWR